VRRGLCAAALLIALAGCGGSKKVVGCPPPLSTASAGNAQVSARAVGKGFAKRIVIRATEKASGEPVRDGTVSVRAEMTCPDYMPMYTKALKEASPGTYKGSYDLVMQGQWTFHITVRSKAGDATTSAFPVTAAPESR
jgi:YtkA-like